MTQTTPTIQPATTFVAEARGVTRDFQPGSEIVRVVHVLRGIDLSIAPGELVALRGRSGSGKTTLLNILVGLDDPTKGEVSVLGQPLARMNEAARAALRCKEVGLLFQNAHLFASLTALENVEVALRLAGTPSGERHRRALDALELVGLSRRAHHRALELSGGEQQRVALARALVHNPRFVVADEPTGNLDSQTGQAIVALLRDIVQKTGVGMLIATHDALVYGRAHRVVQIQDGRIVDSPTT
ncbi:MAG TPA: ABC transporter ATP-binding protein [Ktedonobacteraceae bacterium]|nr:ABC transporter ATP-binding protein [Ktedonobacteraceae bacterium]